MTQLQIIYHALDELYPDPRNARTHSDKQVKQVAHSIERFGFNSPILIDAERNILAGHCRARGARLIGMDRVPTVRLDHLTPAQKRAYILADNKLAMQAGWSTEILAAEFQYLIEIDSDFEITATGFDMAEIDIVLGSAANDGEDDPVELGTVPRVARSGDLWLIGEHRLFVGDALDPVSYEVLLGDELAQMVFTDPPYNRRVDQISNLGKKKHPEFLQASGEMTDQQFRQFLTSAFRCLASASIPGSIHYICMDWRGLRELLAAGDDAYTELKNIVVWVKDNAGLGALYRSRHEMVAVFKSGEARHINNIMLGKSGRYRTNVWEVAGNNSFHAGREDDLNAHPTPKPVALYAEAMLDCSTRNGIILDPFGGSGTCAIAAHRTGRRARLIELDPLYADVTLQRARKVLGIEPVNAWTGATLDDVGRDETSATSKRAA